MAYRWVFMVAMVHVVLAQDDITKAFDVTTLYKLSGTSGDTKNIAGRILARSNARGLPLRRGDNIISGANLGLWGQDWQRDGWRKLKKEDIENLESEPILDPQYKTMPLTPDLQKQADGSWGGRIEPGDLVRVTFLPRNDGRGFLSFLMCDSPRLGRCVGATLSGQQEGRLRLMWSKYGIMEKRGPYWAPGAGESSLRLQVLQKDEAVKEVWDPVKPYPIILEFMPDRKLRIRLDDGKKADPSASPLFEVPKNFRFISVGSYKYGHVEAQVDTVWRGHVNQRSDFELTWEPSNSTQSHLGIAICRNATQDNCYSLLLSGAKDGRLRYYWTRYGDGEQFGPYWVPGRGPNPLMNTPIFKDTNVRASWDPRQYKFTLKVMPQRLQLSMEGGIPEQANELSWPVPPGFTFLALGPYRNQGRLNVKAPKPPLRAAWPVWTMEYGRAEATMYGPPFPFPDGNQLCLLVSASVPPSGSLRIGYRSDLYRTVTPLAEFNGSQSLTVWKARRVVVNIPLSRAPQINLVVEARTNEAAPDKGQVFIQLIDVCEAEGDEDVYAIFSESMSKKEAYGFDVAGPRAAAVATSSSSRIPCRHGGIFDEVNILCRCPPGFTGAVCDIGCGANRIGADCRAKCSNDPGGCSGMLVCGPGMPCSCAPGFTGPTCEQECPSNKYGPGCAMQCGNCYGGDECDTLTGQCRRGCTEGFQPPLCQDRCGNAHVKSTFSIGGTAANAIDFPWVTAIYLRKSKKFVCGGSLVRPNVIVTAMHCLWDRNKQKVRSAEDFIVALGKTQSKWEVLEADEFRSNISAIFGYDAEGGYADRLGAFRDDIAVLLLSSSVPRDSRTIAPVCLDFAEPLSLDRNTGTVAGWGEVQLGAGQEADRLLTANLPFMSKRDCRRFVSAKSQVDLTLIGEDKFCAGTLPPGSNNPGGAPVLSKGDSGSGYCFRDARGTWFLRGVVSAGLGSSHEIMTFSDVNYYKDFIKDNCDRGDFADATAALFER